MAAKKKKVEIVVDGALDEKKAQLNKLVADINKKMKGEIVSFADQYDGSFLLRRPTGILSLDIALKGGFPRGIVEVIGEEQVGKTTLLAETCKRIQEIYGHESCIGLAMVEAWDKAYWKNLGFRVAFSEEEIKQAEEAQERKFNEDELLYLRDQVGEVIHCAAVNTEDMLGISLDLAKSKMFQLVGLDSIGALQSRDQEDKEIGEKTYAGSSVAITHFVNKFYSIKSDTTMYVNNQLRKNLARKSMFDEEWTIPGGQALKYAKFISLFLSKGQKITKTVGDKEVIIGRYVNWNIKKGKCGSGEGKTGSYAFMREFPGQKLGIDLEDNIATSGLYYEVIDQSGAWYSIGGEKVAQGFNKLKEYIRENPELRDSIAKECIKKSGIKFVVK